MKKIIIQKEEFNIDDIEINFIYMMNLNRANININYIDEISYIYEQDKKIVEIKFNNKFYDNVYFVPFNLKLKYNNNQINIYNCFINKPSDNNTIQFNYGMIEEEKNNI